MIKVVSNQEQTKTGPLPIAFNSDGTPLTDYKLYGTAEGAGTETENLFDKDDKGTGYKDEYYLTNNAQHMSASSNWAISAYMPVTQRVTYVVWWSMYETVSASAPSIEFYTARQSSTRISMTRYENRGRFLITAPSGANYARISFYKANEGFTTFAPSDTMITEPIPYGYSVPLTVTSGEQSQDVPIYIGSTKLGEEEYVDYGEQKIFRWADITGLSEPLCGIGTYTDSLDLSTGMLTRRIKKLVLTGEEGWVSNNGEFFFTNVNSLDFRSTASGLLCSHLPVILRDDFNRQPSAFWGRAQGGDVCLCTSDTVMSLSNFKSYLASQYAASTPVTLWYVLAEPETSTIFVPIGLAGAIDGYLIQDGTPTPETPIYPTANGIKQADGTYTIESVGLTPTDPPVPLPPIPTYQGENTLSCSEGLGDGSQITYVGPKEETIVKIMRTEIGMQELTAMGPLPITFESAKGQLVDYKFYGTPEGAGTLHGEDYYVNITIACGGQGQGYLINVGKTKLLDGEVIDYAARKVFKNHDNLIPPTPTNATHYIDPNGVWALGRLDNSGNPVRDPSPIPPTYAVTSECIPVKPNTYYTLCSGYSFSGGVYRWVCVYDKNKEFLSFKINGVQATTAKATFKTTTATAYVRVCIPLSTSTGIQSNEYLMEGSSPTYTPYIPDVDMVGGRLFTYHGTNILHCTESLGDNSEITYISPKITEHVLYRKDGDE